MSYVCLLVSSKGAVASGDSRITFGLPLPFSLHHDHGCKVFKSNHTVWACCGLTRKGLFHYPTMVKRIMDQDDVLIYKRLRRVERLMKFHTKTPLVIRFWHRLTAPVITIVNKLLKRHPKEPHTLVFNLLYADYSPSGKVRCGSICVKNGEVISERVYHAPVMVENGMNMRLLTPASAYIPATDASLSSMKTAGAARVEESIAKDRELKQENPRYRSTIGGKVRQEVLEFFPH